MVVVFVGFREAWEIWLRHPESGNESSAYFLIEVQVVRRVQWVREGDFIRQLSPYKNLSLLLVQTIIGDIYIVATSRLLLASIPLTGKVS